MTQKIFSMLMLLGMFYFSLSSESLQKIHIGYSYYAGAGDIGASCIHGVDDIPNLHIAGAGDIGTGYYCGVGDIGAS